MFAAATAAVVAATGRETGERRAVRRATAGQAQGYGLPHANERRLFASVVICLSLRRLAAPSIYPPLPAAWRAGVAFVGVRLMLLLNCALCVFVFAGSSSLIEISAEFSIKSCCAFRFVSCKYLQRQLLPAATSCKLPWGKCESTLKLNLDYLSCRQH